MAINIRTINYNTFVQTARNIARSSNACLTNTFTFKSKNNSRKRMRKFKNLPIRLSMASCLGDFFTILLTCASINLGFGICMNRLGKTRLIVSGSSDSIYNVEDYSHHFGQDTNKKQPISAVMKICYVLLCSILSCASGHMKKSTYKGKAPELAISNCFDINDNGEITTAEVTSFLSSHSSFDKLLEPIGGRMGLQTTTYSMAMEISLPPYRGIAGALLECCWGVTVVVTGGVAYLIQSWRYIQLAIALPSVITVVYIWFVPESLRWLIMTSKMDQAEHLVKKISDFNKLSFPEETMERLRIMSRAELEQPVKQYTFMDLLRTPRIRKRSFILFYLWFAVAVSYYGLTLKMTSLAGNKYLNFTISGCVELCAYILAVFIITRFGRKKPLMSFFAAGALSCIIAGAIPFINKSTTATLISTGFAIVGKFGMGGVFSVIFLYTSELYPTLIRNIGMGSCAFWTRFGGVVAPQVIMLGDFTIKSLSVIVIGIIACIATCLVMLLPETVGKKLPDNIDDVENEDGKSSRKKESTSNDLEEKLELNPKV